MFVSAKDTTREDIARHNPRWDEEDVDVELATLVAWDSASAYFLDGRPLSGFLPAGSAGPSLVQLAEPSILIGPEDAARLRTRGFEVRTVSGAGHTIHRDDFDGFMKSLDGWI